MHSFQMLSVEGHPREDFSIFLPNRPSAGFLYICAVPPGTVEFYNLSKSLGQNVRVRVPHVPVVDETAKSELGAQPLQVAELNRHESVRH